MDANLIDQLPKTIRIKEALKSDILSGKFGVSGNFFISVRAIAATRGVSLKTAQRIMTLLKKEGYVVLKGNKYALTAMANPRMTRLVEKKRLLGLVVTNLENPFFAILAKEVEMAAMRAGFRVLMAGSHYEFGREKEAVAMFQEAGAAGIIVCPAQDKTAREFYAGLEIPYVLIGRRPARWDADAVLVHNVNAGRMVAGHFLDTQYLNFGYFGLAPFHPNPRFNGYRARLDEAGRRVPEEHIVLADPKNMAGAAAPLTSMLLAADKPLAVFCFHDLLAEQLIRICRDLKLRVPADVAVCGFDNLPLAATITPSLTTVAYPISEMAGIAVARLAGKIGGDQNGKPFVCYLEPSLVIRESSAGRLGGASLEFAANDYSCQLV